MKYTALFTTLLVVFATSLATTATQAQIIDGILTTNDIYTNQEEVQWYNSHKAGDWDQWGIPDPNQETTVRWANQGGYFYLFIEVPLEAKNMIWGDAGDGVTTADMDPYELSVGKMTYKTAVGSEKLLFGLGEDAFGTKDYGVYLFDWHSNEFDVPSDKLDYDGNGNNGDLADLRPKLVEWQDSVDYLLANGATEQTSLTANVEDDINGNARTARTLTESYEFKFTADAQTDVLNAVRQGIAFHLSPPKTLPEPSSALLLGLASIGMLLRRRR